VNNAPDLTIAALKMVISLAVVLAVIWGLYRVAKRNLPMASARGKGKMIQILESQYLGMKKNITMVQVPGAILVLGVSPDQVNLLSQIDNPDIIKSIADRTSNQRSVVSFKDQLRRLTRAKADGSPTLHDASVTE
jgi:flagellar protein FliO/FliZ